MVADVRRIFRGCLIAAAALAAGLSLADPAAAQSAGDRAVCNDPKSTDDQTIAACSALIASGRDTKHNLVVDYTNRGLAYYDKHNIDPAIKDYNQALQIDPNFAQAYNGRCAAFAAKGNTSYAIMDCDQAIQINPKFADAYNNRGLAKRARGDTAGGDADIARARQLDPNIGK